jgi:hypothetical protein
LIPDIRGSSGAKPDDDRVVRGGRSRTAATHFDISDFSSKCYGHPSCEGQGSGIRDQGLGCVVSRRRHR